MKGDPKFDCENYSTENSYTKCVKQELVSEFHKLIGWHPPHVFWKKEGMCNQTFNVTRTDWHVKEIERILNEIVNDHVSISCRPPCHKYHFKTEFMYGGKIRFKDNLLRIVFSKDIEHTKTYFSFNIQTLLTGFGGAVSSGQTLMWIVITLFLLKKFRQMVIVRE